jgi:DNA-binding helix-hairpin-helix protein with protein kinase domain
VTGLSVGRPVLGTLGAKLGEGGQAKVYAVPLALPDVAGPLGLNHYRPRHPPTPSGLEALVLRRMRMEVRVRDRLDARAAWPVRTVEEDGEVCGVLMPLIPDDFFHPRYLPSGSPDKALCEWQHLFVDPERNRRLGMPAPNAKTRVLLCRDFASVLHLLHSNDFVVGDINAKNAVFRLTARPSVRFVDCDGIRVKGSAAVVAQLNAPDWDPPERTLSQSTDLYKFGLLVLRTLCPGNGASLYRDPDHVLGVLGARGHRMLTDTLGAAAERRPSAIDWGRYLDDLLGMSQANPKQAGPQPSSTPGWVRDPGSKRWVPLASDART